MSLLINPGLPSTSRLIACNRYCGHCAAHCWLVEDRIGPQQWSRCNLWMLFVLERMKLLYRLTLSVFCLLDPWYCVYIYTYIKPSAIILQFCFLLVCSSWNFLPMVAAENCVWGLYLLDLCWIWPCCLPLGWIQCNQIKDQNGIPWPHLCGWDHYIGVLLIVIPGILPGNLECFLANEKTDGSRKTLIWIDLNRWKAQPD